MQHEMAKELAKAKPPRPQRGLKRNCGPIPSEYEEQKAVISWATMAAKANPDLNLLIAIPNASGKLAYRTQNALNAIGRKKGFPDLALFVSQAMKDGRDDWHGLFIELKRRDSVPSDIKPEQLEWGVALTRQGYCHRVCKGATDAIRVITQYLEGEL